VLLGLPAVDVMIQDDICVKITFPVARFYEFAEYLIPLPNLVLAHALRTDDGAPIRVSPSIATAGVKSNGRGGLHCVH